MENRQDLINRMVSAFIGSERGRYEPVQRFELIGSDGKSYGGSLPHGVTFVKRGKEYWVLMSAREGTTHGKRHDSKASLVSEYESRIAARGDELKSEFDKMDEKQLAAQAAYWLKETQ